MKILWTKFSLANHAETEMLLSHLFFIGLGSEKEGNWRMGSNLHKEKFFPDLEINIRGSV